MIDIYRDFFIYLEVHEVNLIQFFQEWGWKVIKIILIPYVSDYALDSVFRAFVNRWLWMEGSEVAWGSVSWSFWQPFGITCFGISAQTLHNVLLLMNEKYFRTSYISAYPIDIIVLWNINLVGCNIPWVLFLSLKWEKLRSYSRGITFYHQGEHNIFRLKREQNRSERQSRR